jgi:ABC-2 type transport system ATP-binding protein
MNTIEMHNLTKNYGKARGITDVSFTVKQGEIFGFIGPNGAGKSTTIRTLLGLIKPTSGSAKIFGKDIIAHGPIIREDIGYLPSEVFYYDNMRVIDLLTYSASFYKKPQHEIMLRRDELIKRFDLDVTKKIDDLSYGNRKKVGIVQGLQHAPKLVILDEPTGGLDPLMQQTFFNILKEHHTQGATILFSSHILSEVQKLCDRVAIIKDGRIIQVDTMKDLRKHSYVRVRFESTVPIKKNDMQLSGMSNIQTENGNYSFLYRGDVNALTKQIAHFQLKSIYIEEPDLEEIFLHYYQKDS